MKKFTKNTKNLLMLFYITIIAVLILISSFMPWDDLSINLIMFITLKRGIISQNCFWWKINDYLSDTTGANVYQSIKKRGRFVKINIMGKTNYLLTDANDIAQLLELSPNPFGPGNIKNNFFSRFIPTNVGIAVNPDWKYKRDYNDAVLKTDKQHALMPLFFEHIHQTMSIIKPYNFSTFSEMARQITGKIIFGNYNYNPIVYKVFEQADSFLSAIFNVNTVDKKDLNDYHNYLEYELLNPQPNTLLSLGHNFHSNLPVNVLRDQIPHWIFPIAGIFAVHLPRLLALLANHEIDLNYVILEIQNGLYNNKDNYIRKCILELFRLNNAVNSTFRGLTDDFVFEDSDIVFEKGTQFVFFNNPLLRDLFENPNEFIPSRWTTDAEDSVSALMFNQGNQRCPGKELTISLLAGGLVNYLILNNYKIKSNKKFNTELIPSIINPCSLEFEV
jgi:hypothetical protein